MSTSERLGRSVFLLTSGDGSDGDEVVVQSVHATREGAERAKAAYEAPRKRADGSTYSLDAQVEEWELKG